MAADRLLALNCGSSSIKFALFAAGQLQRDRTPLWHGQISDITGAKPLCQIGDAEPVPMAQDAEHPYRAALAHVHGRLMAHLGSAQPLAAIVHRVVPGGTKYRAPVRMDAQVLADLRSYVPLAPLHQPFALDAMEELFQRLADVPQVVCFDTAFHRTQDDVEQMLPLSWAAWQRGLRRFGFHGLSYEYMTHALPARHGGAARRAAASLFATWAAAPVCAP